MECDHCGGVAVYSDVDGCFLTGDDYECATCGTPGSVDEDEDGQASWTSRVPDRCVCLACTSELAGGSLGDDAA